MHIDCFHAPTKCNSKIEGNRCVNGFSISINGIQFCVRSICNYRAMITTNLAGRN